MYSDQLAWDVFFGQIVGIQYHPANPADKRMSLQEIADVVDEMMIVREERCQSFQLLR